MLDPRFKSLRFKKKKNRREQEVAIIEKYDRRSLFLHKLIGG